VKPREILDRAQTPDGSPLELAREHGHFMIRISGTPLMSSQMQGSENAMAHLAHEALGSLQSPRILVGGLGMGFTLRSALDVFGKDAHVTVSELLPPVIEYNRGPLAHLADQPLDDPRVTIHEGDVGLQLHPERWDVILMDVDNGPDAFTTRDNARLYSERGVKRLVKSLRPGGVLAVWSAYPSDRFKDRLRRSGLHCRSKIIRARWPLEKGPKHTIFITDPKGTILETPEDDPVTEPGEMNETRERPKPRQSKSGQPKSGHFKPRQSKSGQSKSGHSKPRQAKPRRPKPRRS